MDIKLIPKEYRPHPKTPADGVKLPFLKKPIKSKFLSSFGAKTNLWLILTFILLVFSLLAYGGLFITRESLTQKEASLQKQVDQLNAQRKPEIEERVKDLNRAINGLKKLLDTHIYPSRLFEMMEQLTVTQVQFTDFEADLFEARVQLTGQAANYNILSKQMTVFENDERIKNTKTSNIKLDITGQVQFDVVLEFELSFLQNQPSS